MFCFIWKPISFADISSSIIPSMPSESNDNRRCVRHQGHALHWSNVPLISTVIIRFSMSSGNVIVIPVDGSKNSDRAVNCKPFLNIFSVFDIHCVTNALMFKYSAQTASNRISLTKSSQDLIFCFRINIGFLKHQIEWYICLSLLVFLWQIVAGFL